ncbi:hypothetical protein [Acidovorax sp. LjRoot66]|uniref:hypothetical protein n=1 Tax=Acidovorax sp. LjRoot66 TaxID=3342334 RepID=UPI003F4F8BFC
MLVERATLKASMAVPQARLVVDVATLFVCSSRVRLRKTSAQKYRDEDGCFHDVSKLAGTWLGRSTSALQFVQKTWPETAASGQKPIARINSHYTTRGTPWQFKFGIQGRPHGCQYWCSSPLGNAVAALAYGKDTLALPRQQLPKCDGDLQSLLATSTKTADHRAFLLALAPIHCPLVFVDACCSPRHNRFAGTT